MSTVINVPVEEVWEFLSDLDTMTQWTKGVSRVEYERPAGVGTTIVATAQLMGRRTISMTITDWEPNQKLGMRGSLMGMRAHEVRLMEPVEKDKTRLTKSVEAEIGGLLRILQPYLSYRMKKDSLIQLEKTKCILEARNNSAN